MNVEELKKILKENKIHFYSYWNKQKLLELVKINDLLPPKIEEPKEEEKPKYVNYDQLRNIRHTPIKVIIEDIETKEEKTFPSIYKAAQFIDKSPQTLRHWGRKKGIWNNKYRIIIEYILLCYTKGNIMKFCN